MSIHTLSADQALHRLHEFSAVIDARSPAEYAHDHLPGAINWPSLNDQERARVGTLYKQVSPFEARKLGASLAAANIARHIAAHVLEQPKHWRPLLYCWRGGQRSGALALVLGQIGFAVHRIEGGYKAFRAAMLADMPAQVARLRFQVLCGPTGSGKTRLLHALAAQGAQVLDLEGLARHRASVLGLLPGQPQPSQKRFEMQLWQQLCAFSPERPVWVEAESKKVGNCTLPDALMQAMRAAACWRLDMPQPARVRLLLEDYPFFVQDPAFFCQRLDTLTALRGHASVKRWQQLAQQARFEEVVAELLAQHYDPGYAQSTQRHFSQFAQARALPLADGSAASLAAASAWLLQAPL